MLWEKITLSKSEIDTGEVDRICLEFAEISTDSGRPEDAVLFISQLPDQLGASDIYFSPKAAEIAENIVERHSGIPSNPPPGVSVKVLFGKPDAINLLKEAA